MQNRSKMSDFASSVRKNFLTSNLCLATEEALKTALPSWKQKPLLFDINMDFFCVDRVHCSLYKPNQTKNKKEDQNRKRRRRFIRDASPF
jgi:hypothetical protein